MERTRKLHRNTPEALVENLLAAGEPAPECPKHVKLRPMDKPFWDGIVRARARRDWTPTELVVAAQLARTQADIEVVSEGVDADGVTLHNARGTPVMNPKVTVLEQLARREMALMRMLHIGTQPGEARELVVQRQSEHVAEEIRKEVKQEDDDLLAV